MNNEYKCGAFPSPKDDRDYKFSSLIGSAPKEIPEYHNECSEPIKYQGQYSMCGAFAGNSYRYSQEWYQNKNAKEFSETYVYGADITYTGEGMFGRDLAQILVKGTCYKHDWEKLGTKIECNRIYQSHRNDEDVLKEKNALRTTKYYFCYSWVEILHAIHSTNGCVIMIPTTDSLYNPQPGGIIGPETNNLYGYHFVCAKDYVKKDNGAYRIRFQNSWGTGWGDNGYGYLDTDVNTFTEAFALVDDVNEIAETLNNTKVAFTDVDENAWYYDKIQSVVVNGLMNGYEDNTFRPDNPITRAELATVIARLKNL